MPRSRNSASNSVVGSQPKDIIRAAKIIDGEGFLKEKVEFCARLLLVHRGLFCQLMANNNQNILREILEFARHERGFELLQRYAEHVLPIRVSLIDDKIRIITIQDARGGSKEKVSYEIFRAITRSFVVTDRTIIELKLAVSKTFSGDWQVALEKYLRWPTTDAPESLRKIIASGWLETGLLRYYGYRVGEGGIPERDRRDKLEGVINAKLSAKIFDGDYMGQWGDAGSFKRLMKLANTIAAMCRNAKRSPFDYKKAISEWEADLAYLKEVHYERALNLEMIQWPQTG